MLQGKRFILSFLFTNTLGIVGMIGSSLIIGVTIYKVLKISQVNKINTYQDFCNLIGNKKLVNFLSNNIAVILNNVVNIFLLITYFVMIAGFSSFMKQEFNLNGFFASTIIIVTCYFIFLRNVSGLIKISNYLIPILIAFIFYISLKNIDFINNYNNIFNHQLNNATSAISIFSNNFATINLIIKALVKSVLYASYNCIILIPVLITLNSKIKSKNNIIPIAIASTLILTLLSFAIYNILSQGNVEQFNLEMPIIGIVKKYGLIYKNAYLLIIGISIFTTAISSGCGFLNNCSKDEKTFKRNLILMSISAIFLSQIPFSTLVNLLYPVLGIVGIFEIIVIFLWKPCKN